MRAVVLPLLTLVACKIDLDEAPQQQMTVEDGGTGRACRVSTSAPSCLQAEAEMHSDFAWLQQNMFSTNCSGDKCHGNPTNGTEPTGVLRLGTGFAYKTLLGKEPTDPGPPPLVTSGQSDIHRLVEPGNPKASYLLFIMKGFPGEEGTPPFPEPDPDVGYMPQKNNTLCCQKLDAVERWIAAGALP